MSGTNDRKSISGADRRKERALKEQQDRRKTRNTAIIVIVVVAVLFGCALFLNSKYIRRTVTAVTVDGMNFTAAEYDYFFNTSYYEYSSWVYENMADYASSMLPSSSSPLSSQVYDQETGKTWAEFFAETAFSKMSDTVLYYNAAIADNFVLSDEQRAEFEEQYESMRSEAELYGYKSFDEYIRQYYGSNMNEKCLRRISEMVNLASAYGNHVRESFTYTTEKLSEYYAENKDTLDIYSYRYFTVYKETVDTEGLDGEEYEAAEAAALAEAVEKAKAYAAGIDSEEDFIAAALDYDAEEYAEPDSTLKHYSGDMLGSYYGDWLRDSAREYGDVDAFEMTNGCYVVYYIDRSDNDYLMTAMRQILITPETVTESDYADDAEYDAAVEEANKAAGDEAETVLTMFEEGGATEEILLELMSQFSDDTTEGGLYEDIYMYQMVPSVNDWLFESGREAGDYTLVSSTYGWHLMYFTGFGERRCDYLAEEKLRESDYNAWVEGLGEANVQTTWAFRLKTQ